MKHKTIRRAAAALVCAAVFTAAALLGLFYNPDQMLADSLYQAPEALDGNIFVIGIDDQAMEDIGPYQAWGRDVMAMAIEALNADPDCRPAVIGIDVLYTRETDPDLDAYLAEAAGTCGNVVVASVANFGTELVTEATGNFYLKDYSVLSYEEPYAALKAVTAQGHINAMYDQDGVLRHSILQIDLPDGRTIPSFSYAICQKYAAANGLPVELDIPTDDLHRFYVDYSALPGGFYEGISVSDLLSGDFPAELFADAIVLIGPYATGLSDYVTTAAGTGEVGYRDGSNRLASFDSPTGLAADDAGTVYIADSGNGAVRAVKDGYVTTLTAMDSGSTYPVSPRGLLLAGNTLYVGDVFSRVLFPCEAQAAEMDFTDVAKGTWCYDAVRFVWANDLFQGTGEGTFSPGSAATRGMAVTALARLDGVDTTGSDPWYEAGRQWAMDNGISDGTGMEESITREQLAAMLYRYIQSQGKGFTGAWAFPLDYADADEISAYAYEAMCWMTMEEVITGVDPNTPAPRDSATRAQVAAMLQRLADVLSAG